MLAYTVEALSWGDAGLYLATPGAALGGAAVDATGTPEQKERFLKRFSEGEPKWAAMACLLYTSLLMAIGSLTS